MVGLSFVTSSRSQPSSPRTTTWTGVPGVPCVNAFPIRFSITLAIRGVDEAGGDAHRLDHDLTVLPPELRLRRELADECPNVEHGAAERERPEEQDLTWVIWRDG